MAGPITTAQVMEFTREGILDVVMDTNLYKESFRKYFSFKNSHRAVEYDVTARGLGTATIKPEGAATDFGSMQTAYTTVYRPYVFSFGFSITREAIKDNLYKDMFPRAPLQLMNSLSDARQTQAASVLNNAFNPARPGGDGVELCSTAHPIQGGVFANTWTNPVGLNEAGVEDMYRLIQDARGDNGMRIKLNPRMLVISTDKPFTASRLCGSDYAPENTTNAINPIKHMGLFPEGFVVDPYLTNPNAWYVITDVKDGLTYIEREKPFFNIHTDFGSDNVFAKGSERYAVGWTNPRGVFGSVGL